MDTNRQITVTSPLLPDLDEFNGLLKEIWQSKQITNIGRCHCRLETELAAYLKTPYLSLFTNGTFPLLTALKVLKITGEVITTPYTFAATTHSILWNGCTPVFVDIDPHTGNMAPDRIEAAVTPRTAAILPVHVYGHPCDMAGISEIAEHYHLKVIYDAAHAFGVEVNGKSILEQGDVSTLSFHATKVFNTVEGGAMTVRDEATKRRVDEMKNFGFNIEGNLVSDGMNSKMDEIRAAFGLLTLKLVDSAIEERRKVAEIYRESIMHIPGINLFDEVPQVKYNYNFFPILIDADRYGMSRDELFRKMKNANILGRRYFYPLISDLPIYRNCPGADNLPNARKMSDNVICLPIHHQLTQEDIERVLKTLHRENR